MAYFRSDIDVIVFFCWAGWKWVGRRDCLTKKNFFFTSSGAQRWAEREMGNTKKNTATLSYMYIVTKNGSSASTGNRVHGAESILANTRFQIRDPRNGMFIAFFLRCKYHHFCASHTLWIYQWKLTSSRFRVKSSITSIRVLNLLLVGALNGPYILTKIWKSEF